MCNVRIVVQSSKLVLSVMCLELRTWLGHKEQENNGDGFKEENTGDRIDVERILCLGRVQEKEESLCSNDTYLDSRWQTNKYHHLTQKHYDLWQNSQIKKYKCHFAHPHFSCFHHLCMHLLTGFDCLHLDYHFDMYICLLNIHPKVLDTSNLLSITHFYLSQSNNLQLWDLDYTQLLNTPL